jgi:hypothetical protein
MVLNVEVGSASHIEIKCGVEKELLVKLRSIFTNLLFSKLKLSGTIISEIFFTFLVRSATLVIVPPVLLFPPFPLLLELVFALTPLVDVAVRFFLQEAKEMRQIRMLNLNIFLISVI